MTASRKRVFVAGHKGMVGSAIVRQLEMQPHIELVLRQRCELNLLSQADVQAFFDAEKIDQVYLAAAKVGGIMANNVYPANFIYENLMIECNIIHAAHMCDVNDLLFLGSWVGAAGGRCSACIGCPGSRCVHQEESVPF